MATAIMAVKFAKDADGSLEPLISKARGEIIAKTGDGLIVEFAKPAKAMECARLISEAGGAPHRIGLHIGEAQAGGAAQAVKLAGAAGAGAMAISREVLDAVRRIRGGYATSIGELDFGIVGPVEVLHVFRPKPNEMKGGHSKLIAPILAAVLSLMVLGGYAIYKKPSLLQMTLGIVIAPSDVGPGAGGAASGFQQAPKQ